MEDGRPRTAGTALSSTARPAVRPLAPEDPNMTLADITRLVQEQIPITRHLGAVVADYDGTSIRLEAPLAPNVNHRATAFGGSLSALAILAGWTLLHLALRERGLEASVVIQRSALDFDRPIDGDFCATARLPAPADWERFLATFRRRGRARVHVRGAVESPGSVGGAYEGAYVALRSEPGTGCAS